MDGNCYRSAGVQTDVLLARIPGELLNSTGIDFVFSLYLNSLAKEGRKIFNSVVQDLIATAFELFFVAIVCADAIGEFSDGVFHIICC